MADSNAVELAKAYVTIIPSMQGSQKAIADELVPSTEKASDEAGAKGGKSLIASLSKGIAAGAAAVAAAASALAAGALDAATKTASYGDQVDKMSQKIGLSAKSYQQWDYVMKRAGTDVNLLQTGMKTLSTAAQNGSDAFGKLGLSMTFVKNASPEELLDATIQKLAGMEEGTKRTAIASQLLGRSATELAPLLNQGTEAIAEQMQTALDYGLVMSDDMVSASAAWTDSMTTLQGAMEGFRNNLVGGLLPDFQQVTDGLAMMVAGMDGGAEMVGQGFSGIIAGITARVPQLLSAVSAILPEVVKAVVAGIPQLVTSVSSVISELVKYITANASFFVDATIQVITSLLEQVPAFITLLAQAIPQIIESLIDALTNTDNLVAFAKAGEAILLSLVTNLPQIIVSLVGKAGELIEGIIDYFSSGEVLKQFAEAGWNLMKGLAEGIWNGITSVYDAITGVFSGVMNKVRGLFGIASPSKVFAQIGDYCMQGLSRGFDDGVESAKASLTSSLNAVTGNVTATVVDGTRPASITIQSMSLNCDSSTTADDIFRQIRAAAAVA